jgi:release factor glutamine methyltransferase
LPGLIDRKPGLQIPARIQPSDRSGPLTIIELLNQQSARFTAAGFESPRLEAELVVAHVLQRPRLALYLDSKRVLAEAEIQATVGLIHRRLQHEPLQYLTGVAHFLNQTLSVSESVLIPRPETERLVLRAVHFLEEHSAARPVSPTEVLDLGTGSGCIAIGIAARFPGLKVHAIDISKAALEMASRNAAANGVADRIEFHSGDFLNAAPAGATFDLIVSNPPYIPTAEIQTLPENVRDFEPHSALDGGWDGLDFYRILATSAAPHLRKGGRILLEFGDGQAEALIHLFQSNGWVIDSVEKDLSERDRILMAHPQFG